MMSLVDQATTALNATAWDMQARGNIAAAEAYRAAADLVAAVFKDAPEATS